MRKVICDKYHNLNVSGGEFRVRMERVAERVSEKGWIQYSYRTSVCEMDEIIKSNTHVLVF